MQATLRPVGEAALLVELGDLQQALTLYAALQAAPLPGQGDLVPAACTVLVAFSPWHTTHAEVAAHIQRLLKRGLDGAAAGAAQGAQGARRCVEIPVVYNGEDLEALAATLGLTRRELIARHTATDYLAAFAGFAPGFVYLVGDDPLFAQVPRLPTPRVRVPAGAVALAGHFSAVYPKASPGGWQLIGTTPLRLWDAQRADPALIQPGFRVRFHAMEAAAHRCAVAGNGASAGMGTAEAMPAVPLLSADEVGGNPDQAKGAARLHVVQTGLQTLVQDAGRFGYTALGVSASGALDQAAMRRANRCVGNPAGSAVLEHLLGGLVLRCEGAAVLAVTGAPAALAIITRSGARLPARQHQALALDDGDCLHIGPLRAGLRCYVAVRGGLNVAPVLGSCATDTLAELGPQPLRSGDVLAVGTAVPLHGLRAVEVPAGEGSAVPAEGLAAPGALPVAGDAVTLDLWLGPRDDWFDAAALELLQAQSWQVTPQSNRVGLRLKGAEPLARAAAFQGRELPSEGTVAGALQVPASGQPVLFLADHPLTGGYPVVGVLARHHLDLAAQLPPGVHVRFRLRRGAPLVTEKEEGAPCAKC